ncbi:hypothetical protein HRI_002009100 [Hibiscus trionum]|uniref:CCHC-type domain-containing protein n=1 Tax=Hibiscus trionum TaxID=183268 RepID=A0A9W7HTW2_HIBTR|nr:hypothetical protein HRI_002009100 [Hibiscus trionum]
MEINTSKMIMLNGTNYQFWQNKMKDLLFVKALHLPIFATKKPESKSDEEWEFEHQQSVMNQLLGMGVKFDDEILRLWLLVTLPDSWETFRVSLINFAPQRIITLDLAKSGVLNEEVRRRSQSSTSQSEVLVTKNRGINRDKDGKDRDKSRSKSRSRYKNLECHHCGKKGHIKKYCFKMKKENKGGGDKHDRKDDEKPERVVTATYDDLLVICDENLVNLACDETSWVIDTGASLHVTRRRDFFTSYTPGDFGVLKMGNDNLVPVIGMRNFSLVSNNGTKLTFKDVRHASDIRLNLIFAGKLDNEGFCNTFSEG